MIGLVLALGILGLVLERARPGWALPTVTGWTRRVVLANASQLAVVLVAGVTWDRWMRGASLVSLGTSLGPVAGGVLAYLASTFVFYVWHRARHEVPFLWRACHQMHHSARRIELLTSFYKHPLEQLANSLLSAAIAYPLLGLTPRGAAIYTLLCALAEFAYHVNVRTPRWLGYFVQRPEMHRIHHERGRHAGNYADLPIWDLLFGTYVNPARFDGACGFDEARELRATEMLRFVDVHAEGRS